MTRSIRRAGGALSVWYALLSGMVLVACAGDRESDREQVLASLIAAERAFAAASAEQGVKDAFLAHLADDAILFRPTPVPGKEHLRARPASPGLLSWDPEYADAAADGSLGYTTGPWTYRREASGEPVASGRYLTFWRRQLPDGGWKAVIDHGIGGPVQNGTVTPGSPVATPTPHGAPPPVEAAAARSALIDADTALSSAFPAIATGKARGLAAEDVRVLRDGSEPLTGPEALQRGLPQGRFVFQPTDARIAASADLGYTYGEYEVAPSDSSAGAAIKRGTYLRGWRRDASGRWLLVVDLMTPLPSQG